MLLISNLVLCGFVVVLRVIEVVCVPNVSCCVLRVNVIMFYQFTRRSEEDWRCSVCSDHCEYHLDV